MKLLCPLCSEDFTSKNGEFMGHIRDYHNVEFRKKGFMVINGKPLPKTVRNKITAIRQKLFKGVSKPKIDIKNKRADFVEGIDRCFSCKIFYSKLYSFRVSAGSSVKLCPKCVAKLRPTASGSVKIIYTAFESKR